MLSVWSSIWCKSKLFSRRTQLETHMDAPKRLLLAVWLIFTCTTSRCTCTSNLDVMFRLHSFEDVDLDSSGVISEDEYGIVVERFDSFLDTLVANAAALGTRACAGVCMPSVGAVEEGLPFESGALAAWLGLRQLTVPNSVHGQCHCDTVVTGTERDEDEPAARFPRRLARQLRPAPKSTSGGNGTNTEDDASGDAGTAMVMNGTIAYINSTVHGQQQLAEVCCAKGGAMAGGSASLL
ncbi:hypothetical protein CYMTET_11991, partial [Cymbomonas tetramitiformis]